MNIADLFSREDRDQLEKWCRSHTQQIYIGDHSALCRVLGKYMMYVDTDDESLAPHLLLDGFWEMWVTIAIARYVKPGMVCVDAGANFGYYTLLLSDLVGDKGRVYGYEPQPRLVSLARSTLSVNGFARRAFMCNLALGESTGETHLSVSDSHLGSASLLSLPKDSGDASMVHVVALDGNQALQKAPLDFMKIDVQGKEIEVLRGMRGIIARSPNIAMAMEFTPSEHDSPLDALTEIRDGMGLMIRTIGADGLIRPIDIAQAVNPDTGDHRMLWLTRPA